MASESFPLTERVERTRKTANFKLYTISKNTLLNRNLKYWKSWETCGSNFALFGRKILWKILCFRIKNKFDIRNSWNFKTVGEPLIYIVAMATDDARWPPDPAKIQFDFCYVRSIRKQMWRRFLFIFFFRNVSNVGFQRMVVFFQLWLFLLVFVEIYWFFFKRTYIYDHKNVQSFLDITDYTKKALCSL